MKHRLSFFNLLAVGAFLLAGAGDSWAQHGKVNGVVRDASGDPLPGANVVVKGVQRGAVTDADGYYAIIQVDPGRVTLTGSLVGYETVQVQDVLVIADQTIAVNFTLKEAAVELGELVVIADRPLVEPDKTTSKYTVTLEETERILSLVRNTAEILQLQPGVSVDGSNRLRGSRVGNTAEVPWGSDVAYMVDGVRMNYNDGRGAGGQFRTVNRGAIQELSVLTGVTPAEFGNAQAGVVQIVTKEGGSQYNGWAEYRYEPAGKKHWGENVYDSPQHQDKMQWDNPTWLTERRPDVSDDPMLKEQVGEPLHTREDYTEVGGWDAEANVSGPIGTNVSFVVTAKHSRLANPFPGSKQTGFYNDTNTFIPTGPDNLSLSGSFTFRPTQNLKLKLGGLYQGYEFWSNGVSDPWIRTADSIPGVHRGLGDSGRDLFLPANWSAAGKRRDREELQYLVVTHTISPKTFYEVRLSRSRSKTDTIGVYQATSANNKGDANWFNVGRTAARWKVADRNRLGIKVDLTSQVTKGHLIKAGIEVMRRDIAMTIIANSSPADRHLMFVADQGQLGEGVNPYSINTYVQDKMEFEGMIVNLGLRMDAFNPNTRRITHGGFRGSEMLRTYTRARDYAYHDGSIWSTNAPWHVVFSPRIGISHPITERAQFRFSSGVYLQWADLWFYFGEDFWVAGKAEDRDINGNGRIDETERYNNLETTYSGRNGSHLLRPAKTTAFEVGADWNFVSNYTAAITAYYRSEVEQFTWYPNEDWRGPRVTHLRYSRTLDNGAYGDTRGVELALRKQFSDNFSFNLSYNYQWASFTTGKRGNVVRRAYMDENGVRRGAVNVAYTHPDLGVPVPDVWVEWDAHPSGSEVPRMMSQEDIDFYAERANDRFEANSESLAYGNTLGTGEWDGPRSAEGVPEDKGVYIITGGYSQLFLKPRSGDRRQYGSASMLASFPSDFNRGGAIVSAVLRNMRINLVTRIETGGLFRYSPPEGGVRPYRELAMDSRTDLALERTFAITSRIQTSVFLDVRNLFNQKDRTSPTNRNDYTYYGVDGPRPTDSTYLQYGDVRDRTYAHTPRLTQVGVRFNW